MTGIPFARGGRMIAAAGALVALHLLGSLSLSSDSSSALARFPRVVLWAWERPEDLRFLAGREAGVAFLASTVRLSGDAAQVLPRRQPLRVDSSTPLMAVVRVESRRTERPVLSPRQSEAVVEAALAAARLPHVAAVQIDGDAAVSERAFFRAVLADLRARLDPGKGLSFTALASWCLGDRWLEGLPVDEAVPMFFEMGVDAAAARAHAAPAHLSPVCRGSIGLSTADAPVASQGRRLYLFSASAWTEKAFDDALRRIGP
jgi:hypothetical protein